MSASRKIRIALLGCGTVGGGVLRLLEKNSRQLTAQIGAELVVKRVLVRDAKRARSQACRAEWVTTDPEAILADPDIDIIVEVMGGADPTLGYLQRALAAGKSVITANKFLVATEGPALFATARKHSVDLAFEAAVGGGIPVVRTLRDALAGDEVISLHGILNGTCNYMLTRMRNEGLGFEEVLLDAQKLGYAEAEPSMDVDGHDAAQKLVILSALAFQAKVNVTQVSVEGIRAIDDVDFRLAERFGFNIKHLAIGRRQGGKLELRVHPAMVPTASVLGNINDVLNGVYIQGDGLGPCLLVGRGAGELPTAVSVVGDLADVAKAKVAGVPGMATSSISAKPCALVPVEQIESRYYLRFDVTDGPGILAKIATALGEQGVSVEQMVQEDSGGNAGQVVPILIISHRCSEGAVQAAMSAVANEPFMKRPPRSMRIEDI